MQKLKETSSKYQGFGVSFISTIQDFSSLNISKFFWFLHGEGSEDPDRTGCRPGFNPQFEHLQPHLILLNAHQELHPYPLATVAIPVCCFGSVGLVFFFFPRCVSQIEIFYKSTCFLKWHFGPGRERQ
ncbi:hypothetical protein AAHE18_02G121300 [Arachis hypogaea]